MRSFPLIADGYSGQGKNRYMFIMLSYSVRLYSFEFVELMNQYMFIMLSYSVRLYSFEFVELLFLVSGHSQNENDNAHPVIEGNTCHYLHSWTMGVEYPEQLQEKRMWNEYYDAW